MINSRYLVICPDQLLTSNIYNNFSLRNTICNPPTFYLSTWKKIAPLYTSTNLTHNLLSDL